MAFPGAGAGVKAFELLVGRWRSENLGLWPLSEVDERSDEANESGVPFSDYLIDSWAYRVKSNDDMTTAVCIDYYDGRRILVAPSLAQFFERYVENADALLNDAG